jgi:hypothetical protein
MIDSKDMFDTNDFGLDIVVVATCVSVFGVILNNLLLQHVMAMWVWTASNALFAIYFYGRWKGKWDGGLCDEIMCGLYLFMLVSGVWGLMQ